MARKQRWQYVTVTPRKARGDYRIRWYENDARKETTSSTKVAAYRKADEIEERLQGPKKPRADTRIARVLKEQIITLGHVVAKYIDAKEHGFGENPPLEPCTISDYRSTERNYVTPLKEVSGFPVKTGTKEARQDLRNALITACPSRARAKRALGFLKAAVNWYVENFDEVDKNLLDTLTIKTDEPEKKKPKAFNQEEVSIILQYAKERAECDNDSVNCAWRIYYPMLMLMATTGLRSSEIFALKWSNFTDDVSSVEVKDKVRKYLKGVNKKNRIGKAKSVHAYRKVPVVPKARQALWELRGATWDPNAYAFPDRNGGPKSYDTVRRYCWERIKAECEIRPFGMHGLRHFYGSHLLKEGLTDTMRELLGHHSTAFSLAVYTELLDDPETVSNRVSAAFRAVG